MTTTTHDTLTPTTSRTGGRPADEEGADPTRRRLQLLGGLAMASGPLMVMGGAITSPPQEDGSAGAYIESLGADPFISAVSANLFHYAWVALAFAALAAIGLVRGRRGRGLTLVGGLAAAFGSIQMSGLLYSDWVLVAMHEHLSLDQAVAVFTDVTSAPSIAVWLLSAKVLALLGYPLLFAGLARAGVLSWWLVPVSLLPMVAFGVIGGVLGLVAGLACYAPNFVVAARLVQRSRLA